jgi:glycosyltransferase involved in cell wall biosynthesis
LALTQSADDPATRYRLGHYVALLAHAGLAVDACPWPSDDRLRWEVIERAGDYDAVVVFRRLLRLDHLRVLRQRARWLAYDFDDCVTRCDSTRGYPWPLLDKVIQFRGMVRSVDAITAGNSYLADLASFYNRRVAIDVVPTTVDVTRYPRRPMATGAVIGWIGQPATLYYLRRLDSAWRKLSQRNSSLVVRTIGGDLGARVRYRHDARPWSALTESQELSALSVGLAPLTSDPWTLGKCGLRLIQYLAAGVAAVASPVGVQSEIIDEGAALGARSADEWVAKVERLLLDVDERTHLTRVGRQLVERRYVPTRWLSTVAQAWTGLTNRQVSRKAG